MEHIMIRKMIGKNIALARKKQHLTQEELANKINSTITYQTISLIERGESNFKINTIIKIINGLNVNIEEIMKTENIKRSKQDFIKEVNEYIEQINTPQEENLLIPYLKALTSNQPHT